jgi:uncharacterized membrane protein
MHYSPMLLVHICAGTVGLFSGTAALSFRKGTPRHILAGRIFVASMLTMAVGAVYLAIVKHQPNNIGGGIIIFYLIGTAWLTARRKEGQTSSLDWAALLIPLTLGVLTWMGGIKVVRRGATSQDGVPVGMTFFMGSICLLAAAGDVRMLLRGGVLGARRIARRIYGGCVLDCSSPQDRFLWDPTIARCGCLGQLGSANTCRRLCSAQTCI